MRAVGHVNERAPDHRPTDRTARWQPRERAGRSNEHRRHCGKHRLAKEGWSRDLFSRGVRHVAFPLCWEADSRV